MPPKKKIVKKKSAPKKSSFRLSEILDISVAEKFKSDLINYLEKSSSTSILLDASLVSRITTPCVQIIISLSKSCEFSNIEFKIVNPSESFKKSLNELGLNSKLNEWSLKNA
jgi:anti-anti-sigma regulatory factor